MPGARKQNNAQIVKRNTKLAIRIKQIEKACEDFHARYSAISKKYDYYISLNNDKDPFSYLYKTL